VGCCCGWWSRWSHPLRAGYDASVVSPKSLYGLRHQGAHLAAFSSVDIRPGIPPSSALRLDALRRQART
jgi:hypothetical protein